MQRVTVADLMRETGLSRATVDRVLNKRGHVHDRTRAVVEEAFRRLSAPGTEAPARPPVADIALRVGKGMMAQVRAAWTASGTEGAFHDLHMADDVTVLRCIEALCKDVSRPLILTAKNTDRLVALLANARLRGKRIIAMVSDLTPAARDAFVGLDDRAAGQTAAFLIGRMLGDRPTTVGVVLGSSAFRCHEDREIGFRTGLRAHFPKVVISGEAQGEDNADMTRRAAAALLKAHPALGAIYNVGGGNAGLIDALKAAGRLSDMLVVGHEVNPVTLPLLQAGAMDFAIAGDPADMLRHALRLTDGSARDNLVDQRLRGFGIYTRFNLPTF
ncbi:MAG: LacI family DNA-binding transcriptional regulator [Gemmobacter sp.]|uniref:LacI family DNA-binding transcriptional regulator n=1 Tax=Gemmobacter sp. TaxID=1898957 RepID=UPI001A593526|nr:LacI family DNA-binding transcriptional regulator [Gemmobacter sp.]MBL8562369.1 LacI family DNA-binding transcriptional regulator [Gemmobacter sp.]